MAYPAHWKYGNGALFLRLAQAWNLDYTDVLMVADLYTHGHRPIDAGHVLAKWRDVHFPVFVDDILRDIISVVDHMGINPRNFTVDALPGTPTR